MIAVIFEVQMEELHRPDYLRIAASLADELRTIDGFISIERFQSLQSTDKLLSLSFWRDEDAVKVWRNTEHHRAAQSAGRDSIFSQYRLRIASVDRDYGMYDRKQAPDDSQFFHGHREES
ncbi:antibiotic biosynthesis monooxygenase family protein [Undibacterium sp. RuRC25W]|uniref:antibiotic biosynthesis monooxygenase family protein n=1 Tax=Undibacterium sp. RuRC25W TaxID=3413047 RepID=UPI003BF3A0E5